MPAPGEPAVPPIREGWVSARSLQLIASILLLAGFTYLGSVLMPLLIALFLYFIIEPFAKSLQRRGVHPWLTYSLIVAVGALVFFWVGQIVYANGRELQEALPNLIEGVDDRLRETVPERFSKYINEEDVQGVMKDGAGMVFGFAFGTAFGILESALMVIFYLFFLYGTAAHLPDRIRRAYAGAEAGKMFEIGERIAEVISGYMRVKFFVSLGMAATTALILGPLGTPYWPLWAALTFALNYITYFGSLAACAFPMVMHWQQYGFTWSTFAVIILISVNRVAWIDYAEIRYSGEQLDIDQVLLLLSLAYWGHFWGVVGLILAVPMLTCIKIILMHIDSTRHWANLISER